MVANAMAGSIPIDVALCSNAFEPLAELQNCVYQLSSEEAIELK